MCHGAGTAQLKLWALRVQPARVPSSVTAREPALKVASGEGCLPTRPHKTRQKGGHGWLVSVELALIRALITSQGRGVGDGYPSTRVTRRQKRLRSASMNKTHGGNCRACTQCATFFFYWWRTAIRGVKHSEGDREEYVHAWQKRLGGRSFLFVCSLSLCLSVSLSHKHTRNSDAIWVREGRKGSADLSVLMRNMMASR